MTAPNRIVGRARVGDAEAVIVRYVREDHVLELLRSKAEQEAERDNPYTAEVLRDVAWRLVQEAAS